MMCFIKSKVLAYSSVIYIQTMQNGREHFTQFLNKKAM